MRLLCALATNDLPAVPRHVGANAGEDFAPASQFTFTHQLIELVYPRPAISHAEVAGGPDVVSGQGVHEVHLRGPGPDAAHGDDVGENVGVGHLAVMGQSHAPVERSLGEIEHRRCFGVRESGVSKVGVARALNRLGGDVATTEIDDSLMNGGGGLGREQLTGDRARQRWETLGDRRTTPRRRRTDFIDESLEGAIAPGDNDRDLFGRER